MILGIDLGTSKSVVGFYENGKPVIIPDKNGVYSIPSQILVNPNGGIFAGNNAVRHPDRYRGTHITVSSAKRSVGRMSETDWDGWKAYPQEILAYILMELKLRAEAYLGQEAHDVVIAIPSHFSESQRRATIEAAKIAGLNVHRLMNEATAAALAYGHDKDICGNILVCDMGAGTLDVSVVSVDEDCYDVICIEGDSSLGGDDFDQVIVDMIHDQLKLTCGSLPNLDHTQKLIIREAAERAKIELSTAPSSRIYLPGFVTINNEIQALDVVIERDAFEKNAESLMNRAVTILKKALKSTKHQYEELNALLLIGGASNMPMLRRNIAEQLSVKPFTGVDIITCVAEGAIIQAEILLGQEHSLILDIVPATYGVETQGGVFNRIIQKNTTVPTSNSETFTTATMDQTKVDVNVYQGESEFVKDNLYLGTLTLNDIPPAPRGTPQIEVTFDIDASMIINVKAEDLNTKKTTAITVKYPFGLSPNQITFMQEKLQAWSQYQKLTLQIPSLISQIDILLADPKGLNSEDIYRLRDNARTLNAWNPTNTENGHDMQQIFG